MLGAHDEHVSRFSFGRGPALSTNNVLRSYSAHRTPERTSIAPFRVVELRHLVIWIPRRGRLHGKALEIAYLFPRISAFLQAS